MKFTLGPIERLIVYPDTISNTVQIKLDPRAHFMHPNGGYSDDIKEIFLNYVNNRLNDPNTMRSMVTAGNALWDEVTYIVKGVVAETGLLTIGTDYYSLSKEFLLVYMMKGEIEK